MVKTDSLKYEELEKINEMEKYFFYKEDLEETVEQHQSDLKGAFLLACPLNKGM